MGIFFAAMLIYAGFAKIAIDLIVLIKHIVDRTRKVNAQKASRKQPGVE